MTYAIQTPPHFVKVPKLAPGDKVGVIAPSWGGAGVFPKVYELGLERLRSAFHLDVVEYDHTRSVAASLQERASDIHAAFLDKSTRAVFTVIGGSDQIRLLQYLDKEVFLKNPKAFFGFSDNTHLANYLWCLGIPSYYGVAVMLQLGMKPDMLPYSAEYIKHALFTDGEVKIVPSEQFTEQEIPWVAADDLILERIFEKNEDWVWSGKGSVRGRLWGGCLESLVSQLMVSKWLPSPEAVKGCILCVETSEMVPDVYLVEDFFYALGERGYLSSLSGLLVGRPKAFHLGEIEKRGEEASAYRKTQREAIERVVRMFAPEIPAVFGLDFGHTDPQIPLPFGKFAKIDTDAKQIIFQF